MVFAYLIFSVSRNGKWEGRRCHHVNKTCWSSIHVYYFHVESGELCVPHRLGPVVFYGIFASRFLCVIVIIYLNYVIKLFSVYVRIKTIWNDFLILSYYRATCDDISNEILVALE